MKTKRPLTKDDLDIWLKVARTVQPLNISGTEAPNAKKAHMRLPPAPKPLSRSASTELQQNRDKFVRRGRVDIGRKIDLHDLTRDEAFPALVRRISRAHAGGVRCVLVVTGKGPNLEGVLRKSLPGWLMDASIRPMVASFSQAHIRHGGSGAFYVFLKKRRN